MNERSLIKRFLRWALLAVPFAAFLTPVSSYALGTVSRACKFDTLPLGTQNISARFFYAIGAPDWVLSLPNYPNKADFWVLEALTTDYLRGRYLLFARRWLYEGTYPYGAGNTYTYKNMLQSTWTADEISSAMKYDPHFAPYYLNRGPLFSVRAGDPNIVEAHVGKLMGAFMVVGTHWYYDVQGKAQYRLADTKATSCNLTNWGVGLWDR